MRRLIAAALIAAAPGFASAGGDFVATLSPAPPLAAVPTVAVTAEGLPALPGAAVSNRGPMVVLGNPAPPSARVPRPESNPLRATEGCPVEFVDPR